MVTRKTEEPQTMTPAQCRAARALLDWTREILSREARVGMTTLMEFENRIRDCHPRTVAAIKECLESRGIVFGNPEKPKLWNAVALTSPTRKRAA